ncbi:flagellar motor protein MotD [Aurantivibrio plasticivorans]
MRRRPTVDLDVNHDRWLVSYSDFVTLLFAFFVVMYSISHVNEGKYRVLSSELIKAFDVPASAINPIQVGDPTLSNDPSVIERNGKGAEDQSNTGDVDPNQVPTQSAEQSKTADLVQLSNNFNERFSDLIDDNLLSVTGNEMWLEIELKSSILFPSASADPSLQAKGIFEEIATLLSDTNNPVQVEGFTDNVPISNRRFKNNWELSSARAASVVKLLANNGVSPDRLSAVGYGEHRPIADNESEQGRAKNRRVIVMVSRQTNERPSISGQQLQDFSGDAAKQLDTVSTDGLSTIDAEISNQADTIDSQGTNANDRDSADVAPLIKPIPLENGGLLFSSDPELQRVNPPAEPATNESTVEQDR